MLTQVKRWGRVGLAHVLYYGGVMRLLQAIRLQRRAVVLMYHRVLTDAQRRKTGSHPGILVTCDTFARHMSLLKRRFNVISLEEFADRIRRGAPFASSSCLITFDDGWIDNFENALPILQSEGLPAVIFLPVNFVGTDRVFWRETLTLLLMATLAEVSRRPARRPAFQAILDDVGLAAVLDVRDPEPSEALSDALAPLKGAAPDVIASVIGRLSGELGVNAADLAATDRFMDWSRIESMARHGISFGGHGAEHRLLGELTPAEVEAEVATARTVMDERLAPAVPAFSYPNGSWTPGVVDTVRRAGFTLAFTTDFGSVRSSDDPLTLRRVNISEDVTRSAPMFMARLLGLF